MRPRRFRYYCETHDVWDSSNDFVRYHSSLAGCQLTAWESVPQASPARPNVGGNLSSEGGHVQHPVQLVPGVATDGQAPFNVRMVEPVPGDIYVHIEDLVDYLMMVATVPKDGMMSDVILALNMAREDALK